MKFEGLLVVLVTMIVFGTVARGEVNIKLGDPESQVLATLGEPQGTAVKDGLTYYMYDGGNVIMKDGRVISFPKAFEEAAQRKQDEKVKQAQFAAEQKAKGLVLYKSQWITPELKIRLEENARLEEVAREKANATAIRAQYEREEAARQQAAKAAEDKRRFDEKAKLIRDREANGNKTTIDLNIKR